MVRKIIIFVSLTGTFLIIKQSEADIAKSPEMQALDRGDISVDFVPVTGSEIPKVVVRGVINAPPEKVWAIISDCDVFQSRLPRIRSSKFIEKGENFICEITVALPFPLSDMRSVTSAEHIEGPPKWSRTWTLLSGDYEINEGSWVLEAFGGPDRTLATYTVHAVPKSQVPEWARRRAQESSMPELFEKLRKEVKKDIRVKRKVKPEKTGPSKEKTTVDKTKGESPEDSNKKTVVDDAVEEKVEIE